MTYLQLAVLVFVAGLWLVRKGLLEAVTLLLTAIFIASDLSSTLTTSEVSWNLTILIMLMMIAVWGAWTAKEIA